MRVILRSICRQEYEKNSKKILLPIDTKITVFEFYNSYLRSSRELASVLGRRKRFQCINKKTNVRFDQYKSSAQKNVNNISMLFSYIYITVK